MAKSFSRYQTPGWICVGAAGLRAGTDLPMRPAPRPEHTAWKARAGTSWPRLVNPSAWEKTAPITYTIQITPSTSSRMPPMRIKVFTVGLPNIPEP